MIGEEILRAASSGMVKDAQGKPKAFGKLGGATGGASTAEVIRFLKKQGVAGVDLQNVIRAGIMRMTGPESGKTRMAWQLRDDEMLRERASNVIDTLEDLMDLDTGADLEKQSLAVSDRLYQIMLADGRTNMYDDLKHRTIMQSEMARLEYEHRTAGISKNLETQVFGAFKMPHELNYSYRQALHQRPAYAATDNLLDAWGFDTHPAGQPLHLGAAIVNPDMLQHASSLGQLGDYFRHVSGGTARGSQDVQNNLGGLFKTEGGPVIAQKSRELLRTLPGLDVITRESYKANMQLMVDQGLMTQDAVDRMTDEIFLAEEKAREDQGIDPGLNVVYKYLLPYAKTEQMSQRLKNLQSQRPAIDVSSDLVYYVKTLGIHDAPDSHDKYVAGNIKGVLPAESFGVFRQRVKEATEWYQSQGHDVSDPEVQQKIGEWVTQSFRGEELDPHQLNRGVIGGKTAKRVVVSMGISPMSDFGLVNADYGSETERMMGSTQRMVMHARAEQLDNPLEVQAHIKDVLKPHQTIVVGSEYDLDAGISARLQDQFRAQVEAANATSIVNNRQQIDNITDTLNKVRRMKNLTEKVGAYASKIHHLSTLDGGELLSTVRKGTKGWQDAAQILNMMRSLPEDRQTELFTMVQEMHQLQEHKRAVSEIAFENMSASKQTLQTSLDSIIQIESKRVYRDAFMKHEAGQAAYKLRRAHRQRIREMRRQHRADPNAVTQADIDAAQHYADQAFRRMAAPARQHAEKRKQSLMKNAVNVVRALQNEGYDVMHDKQKKIAAATEQRLKAQVAAHLDLEQRIVMQERGFAVDDSKTIDQLTSELVMKRAQLSQQQKQARKDTPTEGDILGWMRESYEHLDIKAEKMDDGEYHLTASLKPGVYNLDPDDPLRPKKVASYDGNENSATLDGIYVRDENGRKQPMTMHFSAFSKREEGAVSVITDEVTTTYEGGRLTVDANVFTMSEFRSGMRVTGMAKGPMQAVEGQYFDQIENVLEKNRYGKGLTQQEMLPSSMKSQDLFAMMAMGQFKQFPTESGLLLLQDADRRPGIMRLIDDADADFGGGKSVALGLMFLVGAGIDSDNLDASSYQNLKYMDGDLFRQLKRGAFADNLAGAFEQTGWKSAAAAVRSQELRGLMKAKDAANLGAFMGPLEALVLDGRQMVTEAGTGVKRRETLVEGLRRTVATAFATDNTGQFTEVAKQTQQALAAKSIGLFDSLRNDANTMAYKLRTQQGSRWVLGEQSQSARAAGALALNIFMSQQLMMEGSLLDDATNKALVELNLNVDGPRRRFADDPAKRQAFMDSMSAFKGTSQYNDIAQLMSKVNNSAARTQKNYKRLDPNINQIQQKTDELFAMQESLNKSYEQEILVQQGQTKTTVHSVSSTLSMLQSAAAEIQRISGTVLDGTNQPAEVSLGLDKAHKQLQAAKRSIEFLVSDKGIAKSHPSVAKKLREIGFEMATTYNLINSIAPRATVGGAITASEVAFAEQKIQATLGHISMLRSWGQADRTTYDEVLNEKTARQSSVDRYINDMGYQRKVRAMAFGMENPMKSITVEEFQNMSSEEQEQFRRKTELHLTMMYRTLQANKLIELPFDTTMSQALVPTGMQDMTSLEFHYVHAMMKNQFSIYGVGEKAQKDLVDLQTAVVTVGRFLNPNPAGVPLAGEMRRMLGADQLGLINVPFAAQGSEYGKASVLASMIASSADQVTMNEGVSMQGYKSPIAEVVTQYMDRGLDTTKKGRALEKLHDIQQIMTERDLARPGAVDPETGVSRDVQKRVELLQKYGLDEELTRVFKTKDLKGDDILDVKRLKEFTKMEAQAVVDKIQRTYREYEDFKANSVNAATHARVLGDKQGAGRMMQDSKMSFEEYVQKYESDTAFLNLFINPNASGAMTEFYDDTGARRSVIVGETQADALRRVNRIQNVVRRTEEAVEMAEKRTYGKQWLEAMRHTFEVAEVRTRVAQKQLDEAKNKRASRQTIEGLKAEASRGMSMQAALGLTTAIAMPAFEKQYYADGRVHVNLLNTYYDRPVIGVQLGLDVMEKMSMLFPDHTSAVLKTQMRLRDLQGKMERRGTMQKIRDGFGGATLDAEEAMMLDDYTKLLYQSQQDLIDLSQTQVIRQTMSDKRKARGATFVATNTWLADPSEVAVGKRIYRAAGMPTGGSQDIGFGRYLRSQLRAVETSSGKMRNAYKEMLSETLRNFVLQSDDAMTYAEQQKMAYNAVAQDQVFGSAHIMRILKRNRTNNKLNVDGAVREIVNVFLAGRMSDDVSTTKGLETVEQQMFLSTALANRTGSPAMASIDVAASTVDVKSIDDIRERAKNEGTSFVLSQREANTLMLMSATGHQFSQLGDYDGDTYQTVLTEVSRRTNEITAAQERLSEIQGRLGTIGLSQKENEILKVQELDAVETLRDQQQSLNETLIKKKEIEAKVDQYRDRSTKRFVSTYVGLPEFMTDALEDPMQAAHMVKFYRDTQSSMYDHSEVVGEHFSLLNKLIDANDLTFQKSFDQTQSNAATYRLNVKSLTDKEHDIIGAAFGEVPIEDLENMGTSDIIGHFMERAPRMVNVLAAAKGLTKFAKNAMGQSLTAEQFGTVTSTIGQIGTELLGKTYDTIIPLAKGTGVKLAMARALQGDNAARMRTTMFDNLNTMEQREIKAAGSDQARINDIEARYATTREAFERTYGATDADATASMAAYANKLELRAQNSTRFLGDLQQMMRDAIKAKEGTALADTMAKFEYQHDEVAGGKRMTGLEHILQEIGSMTDLADSDRTRHQMEALRNFIGTEMGPELGKYLGRDAQGAAIRDKAGVNMQAFGVMYLMSDYATSKLSADKLLDSDTPFWKQMRLMKTEDRYKDMGADDFIETALVDLSSRAQANFIIGALDFNDAQNQVMAQSLQKAAVNLENLQRETSARLQQLAPASDEYAATLRKQTQLTEYQKILAPAAKGLSSSDANTMHKMMSDVIFTNLMEQGGAISKEEVRYMRKFGLAYQDAKKLGDMEATAARHGGDMALAATALALQRGKFGEQIMADLAIETQRTLMQEVDDSGIPGFRAAEDIPYDQQLAEMDNLAALRGWETGGEFDVIDDMNLSDAEKLEAKRRMQAAMAMQPESGDPSVMKQITMEMEGLQFMAGQRTEMQQKSQLAREAFAAGRADEGARLQSEAERINQQIASHQSKMQQQGAWGASSIVDLGDFFDSDFIKDISGVNQTLTAMQKKGTQMAKNRSGMRRRHEAFEVAGLLAGPMMFWMMQEDTGIQPERVASAVIDLAQGMPMMSQFDGTMSRQIAQQAQTTLAQQGGPTVQDRSQKFGMMMQYKRISENFKYSNTLIEGLTGAGTQEMMVMATMSVAGGVSQGIRSAAGGTSAGAAVAGAAAEVIGTTLAMGMGRILGNGQQRALEKAVKDDIDIFMQTFIAQVAGMAEMALQQRIEEASYDATDADTDEALETDISSSALATDADDYDLGIKVMDNEEYNELAIAFEYV